MDVFWTPLLVLACASWVPRVAFKNLALAREATTSLDSIQRQGAKKHRVGAGVEIDTRSPSTGKFESLAHGYVPLKEPALN